MKRKLIKQGIGGMTIYLPKRWVDERGLTEGQEIEIAPVGNDLLVSAQANLQPRTTSITLAGTESSIRTLITNAYRSGYDLVKVSFSDAHQFKLLKEVIATRLLGFDITKHDEHSCMVESVTEPAEEQFETILKKFLYSVADFLELAQRQLSETTKIDVEEVQERIQKYDNFCRRVITKKLVRINHAEMLWAFCSHIVHASRDIYHLTKLLPLKISPRTKDMMKETRRLFELVKRAYIERDVSLLSEIHEMHQRLLFTEGYALLEHTKGKEIVVAYHLLSAIRNIYLANSPLAGYLV